ncbi:MAG: hypothetical protein IPG04_27835 [Polyangiaceae bacterium]|nr:hypothetical protein [Polyangiaceae bacterium]
MTRWPLLLFVLGIHCGDPASGSPSATSSSSTVASAMSSAAASASSTGTIGVSECDAYVARQRALITGAPEAERPGRVKAVDAIESAWVQQAKTVDQKERLVKTCQASLAALEGDVKEAPSSAPSPPSSASAP